MRRIICAAIAKNCARACHSTLVTSTRRRYTSWTNAVVWRVLPSPFVLHVAAGHQAQLGIHVLGQPCQGGFVTAAPGIQQVGDLD